MFARTVSMRLKANSVAEFNKTLDNEILPLLRKQKGFQDELVLLSSNGTDALGISLWDQKDSAEAYQRTAYQDVQKILTKVTEGTPQVQTYEVSSSTIHQTTAQRRASA